MNTEDSCPTVAGIKKGLSSKGIAPFKTQQELADLAGLIFIFDLRLKKTAVRRSREKFLINSLRNVLVLIDRADDKLHLKHVSLVFISNPFDFTR